MAEEISGAEANDLMEQAIAGTLVVGGSEEVVEENEVSTDEGTNSEDTDNEVEVEAQGDTDDTANEADQDNTDDVDEGDGDRTAQDVEENVSDEDGKADTEEETTTTKVEDDTKEDVDKVTDSVDEDTEEDNTDPVEEKIDNNGIDVEEYNRLKDFHEKLTTTKFKVNGREKTGFTDVDDLITAQQRAGGIEKKFAAVKKIQPFMKSMEENGFIADPAKYELAVRAGNGDVEALKQIILDNKIDPLLDLDVEGGSTYEAKNEMTTSVGELAYSEVREVTDSMGVTARFEDVMFNEFDEASRAEIFKDPATTKAIGIALAEQIENGLYDQVMNMADTMALRDPKFAGMSTFDKYNSAATVVNKDNEAKLVAEQKVIEDTKAADAVSKKATQEEAKKVKAETAKIEKARKEKEYKAKAEEQEKKTNAARNKATNSSKSQRGNKAPKSTPLDTKSAGFRDAWKEFKDWGTD